MKSLVILKHQIRSTSRGDLIGGIVYDTSSKLDEGCERCGDRFITWNMFKKHEHESFRIHDKCGKCGNKFIACRQFDKHH